MTLEQYCQENIFKRLGMTHTTYRLLDNPHVAVNLIQMTSRGPEGTVQPGESVYPIDPKVDMGGSNLYTSGTDFLKLLASLLRNDGKLLRPETTDLMFNYSLPQTEKFRHFRTNPEHLKDNFGDLAPVGMEVDHCLAGMVNQRDLLGGRKAGSITWQGATRCYWWIDRKVGLCGFYGSQIMVLHDQGVTPAFIREFEKTLYDVYEPAAIDR
ncbi:uncharacterized protein PFLUO_LOCUS71 [Penicillium psychrofluorescens]|uniref:uncharacterized protein n=1 Tax=Penicillium psychrofluorescens TaxID=3158075 RepID=UPI003CCD56F8